MASVSRPVKAPMAIAAIASCCGAAAFFGGSESSGFIAQPVSTVSREGLTQKSKLVASRADAFLAPTPGLETEGAASSSALAATLGVTAALALAGASSTRKRSVAKSPTVVASKSIFDQAATSASIPATTTTSTLTFGETTWGRSRGAKVGMRYKDKWGVHHDIAKIRGQERDDKKLNHRRAWRLRTMWFKYSAHFKGRNATEYRLARRKVMKSLTHKKRMRKIFKRERRSLWIMRVRANARLHGISYSSLMCKLKEADININRKILSQLGVYDRPVFSSILECAIPNWREVREYRLNKTKKPEYTYEQLDSVFIPYLEKSFPDIYTDATIRFNRKVHDWGIEYTVDAGDPKMWQEVLPKMPELQNFNLPDHWCGNLNAETEFLPIEYWDWGTDEKKAPKKWKEFAAQYREKKQKDYEAKQSGRRGWPTREGISRESWFEEEPQTWFD
eukprot:TRINITY_DN607_c0_g2_i1.p1 TRINITY_DN607_c0_g2~~TRINITY_DN607_c0_g2_i1.p1  ORF type:complete len:448 (+),score=126.04 TRINITY_DN607_c0_g2_i1:101-1444(+)